MKVRSSVKPMCEKCKVIKRKGSINRDKADQKKSSGTVIVLWLIQ